MKRGILITSLILLGTLLAFSANAMQGDYICGPKMKKMGFAEPFSMRIIFNKELNLSQDQKDKIFNLILQSKQKRDNITTEILKVRYEKESELLKSNPDFNKVKSLNSRLASLQKDLFEIRENLRTDILGVLTSEQRQKLQELYPRGQKLPRGF